MIFLNIIAKKLLHMNCMILQMWYLSQKHLPYELSENQIKIYTKQGQNDL